MATLSHFLTFPALFTHRHKWQQLQQHHSPHKVARFRASSVKKSRKVKTNAELCADIREFVVATGLPEGYVPTMKEFSQHGRNDLAYIVRRRGYKVIGELLGSAKEIDLDGSDVEKAGENKYEEPNTIVGGIEAAEGNTERVDVDKLQIVTSTSTYLENVPNGGDDVTNFNGNALQSMQVVTATSGNNPLRDGNLSVEQQSIQINKDRDVKTSKRERNVEHEKELELSRLKEQIEKEKRALSLLQAKAETEIRKAQKLISEKDSELQAAEEMLSELIEVLIQYHGDGEFVEVAGSFNGWHHWVKMDPQPSSNIADNVESRKSKLWSTVLWLYPGIYEIKFIVDGQWKNDPEMETISHGDICNNILRVCR